MGAVPHVTETILVVEDEEAVRVLVGTILRRFGYEVLEAGDGPEALKICSQRDVKIDLMLTDVIMPRMNGKVLAERVTRIRPGIKIIFMSGYMENVIAHHGVLDAGVALLTKPFSLEGLAQKVREVLGHERARQEQGGAEASAGAVFTGG